MSKSKLMNSGATSELSLVKMISRLLRRDPSVICGIGDDAAVLRYTKDKYLLLTADMLLQGIDFKKNVAPESLGYKALACSLSDIAAMSGIPRYALVSLALPKRSPKEFIKRFYAGMSKLASEFGVDIVGGDLSSSDKIVVDVSLAGEVKKGAVTLRSGASVGDALFVSGQLGGSIYGRHLCFRPRVKEAQYLARHYKVKSMIDISDGLALDLYRLTEASGVGADIYEDLIPVSSDAKSFAQALYMGEDFELLFTLGPSQAERLEKSKVKTFWRIGKITARRGLRLIAHNGKEKVLKPHGYQHF